MQIINLTRENQPPVDGDLVRIVYANGSTEEKRYTAPVAPREPSRAEIITARLAEIDAITDKPRTRRELQLKNAATMAWLSVLNDEADALREELRGIQ